MSPRRTTAAAAALAALTVLPYLAGGAWREFIPLDDGQYLYQNPSIAGGLTPASLRWAVTTFHQGNWHPLTWISHLLDVTLFGLDPRGHHLTSILLHGLNAALLFAALLRLTGALGRSWAAAALFGLHPLRVESVAWVSERKDVLSGLFFMLVLLAYERYARRRGRGRYALVALLLALGLTAKPMLVTLPFVLLLLDRWPLGRARAGRAAGTAWGPLLLEKAPLIALCLASSVVTFLAQRAGEAVVPLAVSPLPGRLATAVVSYAAYLEKTIWPTALAVFYPRPAEIPWWHVATALAALALLSWAALRAAKHRPWAFSGWWWFAGMLVPVIGVVQVGEQALADRYTYLPGIGLALIAAWGAPEAARRLRLRASAARGAAALALCALAVATATQAERWRSAEALLRHSLAVTRGNWMAHVNLGALLARQGRWDEAREHYLETLRLDAVPASVFNNLGSTLVEQGRVAEALDMFREAIRTDPRHGGAHFNLALALSRLGRGGEALAEYRTALDLALAGQDTGRGPDPALIRANLGNALLGLGLLPEAVAQLEQAARERPGAAMGHYNLGLAYAAAGRHMEAAAAYRRSLQLEPGSADAHNNLGVALLNLGRAAEAVESCREAARLAPGSAAALNNLGNALQQAGRAGEAVEAYRAAIAREPGFAATHHNLALALDGLGRAAEAAAARERARLLAAGK